MTRHSSSGAADDAYTVLAGPGRAEIRVERSRFVAEALPAGDEAEARRLVATIARRHHDAHHVCFAWRGGSGAAGRELRSDAGEPAGTAGEPLLGALRRADVTDALIVVARWFGGIKLGTGGLARAYAAAAAAALAPAAKRQVVPGVEQRLVFGYAHEPLVTRLLAQHGGRVLERAYGADVAWRVWLPSATRAPFARELGEATGGAAVIEPPRS